MSSSRASSSRRTRHTAARERVIASSGGSSPTNAGALAAVTWLRNRGMTPTSSRWHVEIALDVIADRAPSEFDEATATRFHISIYTEEWGIYFCHDGQSSWIRVTDIAFVHGRDEFRLLEQMPALKDVGSLLRRLEQQYEVRFQRQYATITTNLPDLEPAVRAWVTAL